MKRWRPWCGAVAIALGVFLAMTWTVGAAPDASPAPPDGEQLFIAKGCASCHAGPDSSGAVPAFPPLDTAAEWAGDRREGISARDYLAESIAAPDAFTSPRFRGGAGPATGMPTLIVTSEEVDALVDYLLGN